jgi:hypothetical protein
MIDKVIAAIQEDISRLIQHKEFLKYKSKESPFTKDDIVVINNTFLHREISTSKNNKYLAFVVNEKGDFETQVKIAVPDSRINKDLKKFSSMSKSINLFSLEDSVVQEMSELGSLVFVLIGELDDTIVPEIEISSEDFKSIKWLESAKDIVEFNGDQIIVKEPYDIEFICSEISSYYNSKNKPFPNNFEETISIALRRLQSDAVVTLRIPDHKIPENSLIDHFIEFLQEEKTGYDQVLHQWTESKYSDEKAYDQLLKISYNFAVDAIRLIKLIVKIFDLKPLVLWGTIAEHFALSEAFRNLYFIRSKNKPFLEEYHGIIADARNRAFHNLYPFQKSIDIFLPDGSVSDAKLRIFTEFGRQNKNQMTFKDKELSDVLLQFTRSRFRYISKTFWLQNAYVIDATIQLFKKTGDFLRLLISEL